jgi:hypothetical protein
MKGGWGMFDPSGYLDDDIEMDVDYVMSDRAALANVERQLTELRLGGLYNRCATWSDLDAELEKLDWSGVNSSDREEIERVEADLWREAKGIDPPPPRILRREDLREQYDGPAEEDLHWSDAAQRHIDAAVAFVLAPDGTVRRAAER